MSRLEKLLTSSEPLEPHEASDLVAWLAALKEDVETFGPTPEDVQRMRKIKVRLEKP